MKKDERKRMGGKGGRDSELANGGKASKQELMSKSISVYSQKHENRETASFRLIKPLSMILHLCRIREVGEGSVLY